MTASANTGTDPQAPSASIEQKRPETGLKKIVGNLAHLLGGKAVAGVMSLVYLIIVTRTLGVRDYGVLVLVNGYAVLIGGLVAFSGFHGVVRYGTLAVAGDDPRRLARIVRFMALIELTFGLLAIVIAMALVPVVGPRLGWSPDAMRLAIPYSFAVLAGVRATPQGLLQIAGRFDLIGIHQAISPVVRLIGSITVWAIGGGLEGFILVWLGSCLIEGSAMWLLSLSAWRKLMADEPLRGPWRGLLEERSGFGRFILITNFDITLRELAPNLAPLTIGWLLGPLSTGLFSLAQRATVLLDQPSKLLSQASYAVLADEVARKRFDALRATVWRSAGYAGAIAAPVVIAFWLAGNHLLPFLGGHTFQGGAAIVTLVAGGRLAALIASPIAAGLTALGKPQRSMSVTLATNLLLYPVLPLLILGLGLHGAGLHVLIQNVIATSMLIFFFARDSRDPRTGH